MARSKRELTRSVTLVSPEDGNDYTFHPGDELPTWAEKAITNPAAFDSDEDYVADDGSIDYAARDAELNKRGRVQRGAPMVNGMGEKVVPENADAAGGSSSGGSGAKSGK